MENRISAIIIDPLKKEHDYNHITTEGTIWDTRYGEKGFELHVYQNAKKLYENLSMHRSVDCIVTFDYCDADDFKLLNESSFEIRKKWINFNDFNIKDIATGIVSCFLGNINRHRPEEVGLFSIFTCTYKTSSMMFDRLYESLKNQTYKNWNWFIIDDSPNDETSKMITKKNDPRITIIKNVSNHGNIGFNKHTIAMMCDGDYLVEVDHDDELTPDCLEHLHNAFTEFPDTDFVYSDAIEIIDGKEVTYEIPFAYGLGKYEKVNILGKERNVALTAQINALSIRGIHACPNHVRCWKSEFYKRIGGHNTELSVLDDFELIIRTFLYGQMTKVNKVLYIQHEGTTEHHRRGATTQAARFNEIQRTNDYLRYKYDDLIHKRILELGDEDIFWINDDIKSNIYLYIQNGCKDKLKSFNHNLWPGY